MSHIEEFDVIVVGLGPAGLIAAALLGQREYRVAVVEKQPHFYGLPRAGHVDHEIVRTLQDLGVSEAFLADAFPIEDYHWYNASREVILSFNWGGQSVSGHNNDYMMYQPVMEDAIVSAIRRAPNVTLLQGHEVVSFTQDDKVRAEIVQCESDGKGNLSHVGETRSITGRYMIAADGARSSIREACGIVRDEQDFNATWLDVDVFVKRPLQKMNPHQICDPRRPAFISPLGKRHHRFEWCILPGESVEEFSHADKAWSLMAELGVTRDDVEIRRQQIYKFEARVARQWRSGRVLLAGDAAHTMPPFMGQGACAGVRDSANLAWKLDLVLRGVVPDTFLDTYQLEREPHARTWIDLSILSGEVSCTLDPIKAAERDAALLSGEAPPMPDFPHLTAGALYKNDQGAAIAPAGELFLQREVLAGARRGLFDDVVGRGFLLIGRSGDPRIGLHEDEMQLLNALGTTTAWIATPGETGANTFEDISGAYAELFDTLGAHAILVRPDHYIFGVARSQSELPTLIGQLKDALGVGSVAVIPAQAAVLLIRNAYVVTQDPNLGELRADILIEGGKIKAIGADLSHTGAEVIDASDFAILPGFVDTHRHTWQTSLRGLAAGATLEQYQHLIQGRFGRLFTPEDVYAGNLLGAITAAQTGITTLCDESHVQNSPAHTDAAVRALKDAGSRAVFDYGWPSIDAPKWMNNSSLTHPTYVRELQQAEFSDPQQLLSLRMMLRGPLMTPIEITKQDLGFARELGLHSAMHIIGGNIQELADHDLLGPDLMFIHCCDSSDAELQAAAKAGASISSSPHLELNMSGFGKSPPIRRFLAAGIRPSLSIDVETSVPGDMFSVMRAALMSQTIDDIVQPAGHGDWPRLTTDDILGFATLEGARACGLADQIGSLTPGKQADLLMIRMSDDNLAPVETSSIVAQIVASGHPGNVDSVMVAGRFIRRHGKPTNQPDIDRAIALARASRARLQVEAHAAEKIAEQA